MPDLSNTNDRGALKDAGGFADKICLIRRTASAKITGRRTANLRSLRWSRKRCRMRDLQRHRAAIIMTNQSMADQGVRDILFRWRAGAAGFKLTADEQWQR
jgi:hypothetical protein